MSLVLLRVQLISHTVVWVHARIATDVLGSSSELSLGLVESCVRLGRVSGLVFGEEWTTLHPLDATGQVLVASDVGSHGSVLPLSGSFLRAIFPSSLRGSGHDVGVAHDALAEARPDTLSRLWIRSYWPLLVLMNVTDQVLEGIIHDFVEPVHLFLLKLFGTGVGLKTD